eukprot:scaffold110217_cov28-Prasinocladus_malaysianus.AAC.1
MHALTKILPQATPFRDGWMCNYLCEVFDYSTGATAAAAGYAGCVARADVPPKIDDFPRVPTCSRTFAKISSSIFEAP